jgi:sulfite oxidase
MSRMHREVSDRSHDLIVREAAPLNAEPPLTALSQYFVTPNKLFFIRNHGVVPNVDPVNYRLAVNGMVKASLSLTLDELRGKFPKRTTMATLLAAIQSIPGVPWQAQAIGNATWGGVSLRDVLLAAEVVSEARHIAFTGLDGVQKADRRFGFGGSIPIGKALSHEVLLAYEMNGQPLPPDHGYPLRVVVPGYIGARSVKWVSSITVQTEPSANFFQANSYKLFPPQAQANTADWEQGLMLGELSVNAVICQPQEGETLPVGPMKVRGYAMAGGQIERVDVSADEGHTWVIADLLGESRPWTWRFWEAEIQLEYGSRHIIARAWDSAANTQPEDVRQIWNFKGYMNNAWHRVKVHVRSAA